MDTTNKHSLPWQLYTNADSPVDSALMDQMRQQGRTPLSTNTSLPRFTLVVGPTPFSMMRGWEFFLTAPYEGATYIATVLHNAGYPIRIVDVRFERDPLTSALNQIKWNTDVLGIATFEDNFPFVRMLIEEMKLFSPNIPIICGGSLVSSVPHLFMEHTKVDIAVIGEGELTILELMASYTKNEWKNGLETVNGIMYRDREGGVCRTRPRGQMPDLDSLPRMRLDMWPQYHSPRGIQPQVISSYSRGCMMDCSFCFRTTPQVRLKSPAKLDEDLRWLKEQYNTNFVFFTDLTFAGYKKQTREICDVIEQNSLRWTCMGRCVDADRERLDAMRKAGCDIILFGVESLGAEALKNAHKPTTRNISIQAMHRSMEAGIRFGGLLIIGLPGETIDDLKVMVQWAEEFQSVCRVKYLSALPGTSIYRQCLSDGKIRSELDHVNWLSIEQGLHQDEFLNLNRLPESFVRDIYARIYRCYQPGPVMEFEHFPEDFEYFVPEERDGSRRNTEYAWEGWRREFSSAGVYPIRGSEAYTLDRTGAQGMASVGSRCVPCGAKRRAPDSTEAVNF